MDDIHPIKPLIETPLFTDTQLFLMKVILSIIVATIFFLILYYLGKKHFLKPHDKPEIEVVPKINYKKEALFKLTKIKKLVELEEFEEFYLKITEIIKWFLTGEFKNSIEDLTSKEIAALEVLPEDTKKELLSFLKEVDKAKFAKAHHKQKFAQVLFDSLII